MILHKVIKATKEQTQEEQESFEILHKRLIEKQRAEIAKEIEEAREEYQKGDCQPSTPIEIMEEILS